MIAIADSLASAIEVDVVDGRDDDVDPPSYAVLRAHFDGRALRAPASAEDAEALRAALVELSNAHDDVAESSDRSDDERRFARRVVRAVETALARLRAAEARFA